MEQTTKHDTSNEESKAENEHIHQYDEIFKHALPIVVNLVKELPPFEYGELEIDTSDLEYRPITYIEKYKSYYKGQWIKGTDIRRGKGISVGQDGTINEGWRINDDMDGKARITYDDGSYFLGRYVETSRQGFGIHIWKDKTTYEGDFKDDRLEGHGKYTFSNGDFYVGEFKDSVSHGKGKLFTKKGYFYDGDWEDDGQHGFGVEKLLRDSTDEGGFPCTKFSQKYKKLSYYNLIKLVEGSWVNDKEDGLIYKYHVSDLVYQGNTKEGFYEGQ